MVIGKMFALEIPTSSLPVIGPSCLPCRGPWFAGGGTGSSQPQVPVQEQTTWGKPTPAGPSEPGPHPGVLPLMGKELALNRHGPQTRASESRGWASCALEAVRKLLSASNRGPLGARSSRSPAALPSDLPEPSRGWGPTISGGTFRRDVSACSSLFFFFF